MDTSDASQNDERMSELARTFASFRAAVLDQWRQRVTNEIPNARRLGEPILVNMLPILYDNIAEALAPEVPRTLATSSSTVALGHGRERANTTEYEPQDLVREMQLFREVLFAVLNEHRLPLDKHDGEVIGHSIEEATCEAIIGYSATHKQINESFITALSHDLRNPLNVASASAQLIQRKSQEPGVVELARRIAKKIAEADQMIQTLLDAAMLKNRMKLKLTLTSFPIMELIEEVCADVPLTGPRVEVSGEPVEGWWCRATLKRVLENLIDNAQKYGDASRPITLRVARADHRVQVSVHNEGEPIPEHELKRLFDAFERLEDVKVRGWGLGLPFVQNAIESHGGDVVVDSARERGTTFTLSLPVDARPYVQG